MLVKALATPVIILNNDSRGRGAHQTKSRPNLGRSRINSKPLRSVPSKTIGAQEWKGKNRSFMVRAS